MHADDPCSPEPCQNGGTCAPSTDYRSHTCSCGAFWTGDNCETDVNECANNNGGCSADADCANSAGAAPTCTCKPGYVGDGKTCTGAFGTREKQ